MKDNMNFENYLSMEDGFPPTRESGLTLKIHVPERLLPECLPGMVPMWILP